MTTIATKTKTLSISRIPIPMMRFSTTHTKRNSLVGKQIFRFLFDVLQGPPSSAFSQHRPRMHVPTPIYFFAFFEVPKMTSAERRGNSFGKSELPMKYGHSLDIFVISSPPFWTLSFVVVMIGGRVQVTIKMMLHLSHVA